MGSQRCNSFFRNKGKRKGLLSRLFAVYEMFCLCETYRESGSVLNLWISHIPFGRDRLPRTFASRDRPCMNHCSLFFRFIYSINRHSDRFLNVADRFKIGKEGEARVCRGAVRWWADLKGRPEIGV